MLLYPGYHGLARGPLMFVTHATVGSRTKCAGYFYTNLYKSLYCSDAEVHVLRLTGQRKASIAALAFGCSDPFGFFRALGDGARWAASLVIVGFDEGLYRLLWLLSLPPLLRLLRLYATTRQFRF